MRVKRDLRYLLYASMGAALLVICSLGVDTDHVSAVEESAFRLINDLPGGIYRVIWVIMQAGNLVAVPVAIAIALLARRFRMAIGFAFVGGAKLLLLDVVKDLVIRSRPAQLLSDVVIRDAPTAGQGYVSGHAIIAIGLASVAHPYLPPRWRYAVWTVAVLVCAARVYVGAHLPLDVVGGGALGAALGWLVDYVVGAPHSDRMHRRR